MDAQHDRAVRSEAEYLAGTVVDRLNAGVTPPQVTQELVARGVERSEAASIVEGVMIRADRERPTLVSLLPAVAGGLLAALVAGVTWAAIGRFTGYEVGILAIGVGVLTGTAVVLASSGRRGLPLQFVAVATAALGIAVGKYLLFATAVREFLGDEAIGYLDPRMLSIFEDSWSTIVSGYDFLWIGLAAWAAWRIPRSMGLRTRAPAISGPIAHG